MPHNKAKKRRGLARCLIAKKLANDVCASLDSFSRNFNRVLRPFHEAGFQKRSPSGTSGRLPVRRHIRKEQEVTYGGHRLKKAQTEFAQTPGDGSPSRNAVVAEPPYLFIMCQILQDQSLVLRRDAMEIRAMANDVRLRARTLRKLG